MTDRIILSNMVFQARHGVLEWEKAQAQRFEVDVELVLDLQPAGVADSIDKTVDYRAVHATTRHVVESTTFELIEALADAIAREILGNQPLIEEIVVRVRKPEVSLDGPLDFAGVEVRRLRPS
jgi:dihydroneopterin aldolase